MVESAEHLWTAAMAMAERCPELSKFLVSQMNEYLAVHSLQAHSESIDVCVCRDCAVVLRPGGNFNVRTAKRRRRKGETVLRRTCLNCGRRVELPLKKPAKSSPEPPPKTTTIKPPAGVLSLQNSMLALQASTLPFASAKSESLLRRPSASISEQPTKKARPQSVPPPAAAPPQQQPAKKKPLSLRELVKQEQQQAQQQRGRPGQQRGGRFHR